MRPGWRAGHFLVIGNAERSVKLSSIQNGAGDGRPTRSVREHPGEGLARSERCDALRAERQLGRRLPGAALQRDPLPVARQAIEIGSVKAGEGLESLQCSGLLEA